MDVIKAAAAASGRQVPYEIAPRRAGDPVTTYADPASAFEVLDWTAHHGLDEIVRSAYEWHRTQTVAG
jgi:UDP-glucose 4-epimerase